MTGKTVPELDALSAPVVDSDALTFYRSPGPLRRTTATTFADYIKAFFSASGGSALVGFLQGGTGAVARTAQAKMRDVVSVRDFGAVSDGVTDSTAAFQSVIDYAAAAGPASATVNGDFAIPGTLTGGSGLTWFLEPGASVTPGKLPGRVLPAAPPTWGPPQSVCIFGETPETVTVAVSAPTILPQTGSGAVATTVGGLCLGDTFTASALGSADGVAFLGAQAITTLNSVSARWYNASTTVTTSSATRTVTLGSLRNTAFRQVFAASRYQGKNCWFVGVDMQTTKSACIFKTGNGGAPGSWRRKFALPAAAIRSFIEVAANTDVTSTDALNTVMLATFGDPTSATTLAHRTTNGWDTSTAVTFTLSGTNPENVLFDGDVEGGQGSNGDRVILGSFRPGNAPATAYISTDKGVTFPSAPIEIAPGTTYDSCRKIVHISGTGASGVWLAFLHRESRTEVPPAVYRSTDGGATWSLLTTVGAIGEGWQHIDRLASGTFLAGTDGAPGSLYRSTDVAATWTNVFTPAGIVPADTKPRCIAESNGSIYLATQDSGHLWRNDNDGLGGWVCEYRFAQQSAPICMSASTDTLLIGTGQGLLTGKPGCAEMFRLIRNPRRHQYG